MSGRAPGGRRVAASEEEVLRILENSKLVPIFIGRARARRERPWAAVPPDVDALDRWQHGIKPGSFPRPVRASTLHHDRGRSPLCARSARSRATITTSVSAGFARWSPRTFRWRLCRRRWPSIRRPLRRGVREPVHTGEISGTRDRIMDQTAATSSGPRRSGSRSRRRSATHLRADLRGPGAPGHGAQDHPQVCPRFYDRFRVRCPSRPGSCSEDQPGHYRKFSRFCGRRRAAGAAKLGCRAEKGRYWMTGAVRRTPLRAPDPVYACDQVRPHPGILVASGTQILLPSR